MSPGALAGLFDSDSEGVRPSSSRVKMNTDPIISCWFFFVCVLAGCSYLSIAQEAPHQASTKVILLCPFATFTFSSARIFSASGCPISILRGILSLILICSRKPPHLYLSGVAFFSAV